MPFIFDKLFMKIKIQENLSNFQKVSKVFFPDVFDKSLRVPNLKYRVQSPLLNEYYEKHN